MDEDWTPPREWGPAEGTTVIDQRSETKGVRGVVLRCDRYGHFADPYWRATVRWGNGYEEQNIETSWLTREDGSQ